MIWIHKEKPKKEWMKHFTFRPVPVSSKCSPSSPYRTSYSNFPIFDGDEIAWLCWIERRWKDSYMGSPSYDYRKIDK